VDVKLELVSELGQPRQSIWFTKPRGRSHCKPPKLHSVNTFVVLIRTN